MKDYTEDFIKGLKKILEQGYDPIKVGNYSHIYYFNNVRELKGYLKYVIDELRFMEAGDEFEMTEQEVKELIKEKLKVDL